jgi:hypothetical protein
MNRKDAIREYKARKAPRGVFAVRCLPTSEVWVGTSSDLDVAQNRLWFALRNNSHYDHELQSAWNTNREEAFRYEILEKIDDEISTLLLPDELEKAKLKWASQLAARTLIG